MGEYSVPYHIVVFCAAPSTAQTNLLVSMIRMLLASARRWDGDVRMTVLTDRATALGELDAMVSRHDVNSADLMLARTRAQRQFVGAYDFSLPLIFLDLDILINRPVASLFDRQFDIGLTWRRKREMPINGGVILASNRRPEKATHFFDRWLQVYEERYSAESGWWGDQRALNELVVLPKVRSGSEVRVVADGVECVILPGVRYNFSPHWLMPSVVLPRRGTSLLHFKGPRRKKYMGAFFELHINATHGPWQRLMRAYRSIR